MKRIGVTINIVSSIFSNGIQQNAIFLAQVLKKAGFIVDLICPDEIVKEKIKDFTKDVNVFILEDSYKIRYNLIIGIGFAVEEDYFKRWQQKNTDLKLVSYQCGNKFLIEMERSLFKKDDVNQTFGFNHTKRKKPHQIWTIPQMEETCYHIYQYTERQDKVTVVPFIWSPTVIEKFFELNEFKTFTPREISRCAVMEPNISVMKNVFNPILTLEKNQKINPFKEIYLFGADVLKDSKPFIDFIKSTEIYKKGIATVEPRISTSVVLNRYSDIVLSWQWENNLNYLWFDVAWMGWPVVHNGSMCKDVGYYYERFNCDEAVDRISEVIKNHNNNYLDYLKRNREIISRYTIENDKLVHQYKILVNNVLNNKFVRANYNPETNLVSGI